MIRYLNVAAVALLLASAVYAYAIKYETMGYQAEIVKARHAIQNERDAIGMLRAEWANLSRPERIQELADRHLDLQQLRAEQFAKVSDLPDRTKVDEIGRKLDALGLSMPTATPRDGRNASARSTTPVAPR
jgi:cell division protein FtsL